MHFYYVCSKETCIYMNCYWLLLPRRNSNYCAVAVDKDISVARTKWLMYPWAGREQLEYLSAKASESYQGFH
jgi:hypothetical protein